MSKVHPINAKWDAVAALTCALEETEPDEQLLVIVRKKDMTRCKYAANITNMEVHWECSRIAAGIKMKELTAYDRYQERQRIAEEQHIERALFQAQSAAIGLAHKVKMYETALREIAWSNNSEWQQDRAKQVLAQIRGVEL